jgi:hypothetical protein
MATKTVQMPPDLLEAIEGDGVLTDDQLRQLVAIEAEMIGLTYDEAVARARADALPRNTLGTDIRALVRMLDAPPSPFAWDDDAD